MPRAFLIRRGAALVPADDESMETVRAIPEGEVVAVDFKRPRNVKFHRLFWKIVDLVAKNCDLTPNQLAYILKVETGHCEVVKYRGVYVQAPKSISFAKMDETEFRKFWDRAVDYLIAEVIPGTGRAELEGEVFRILGFDLENAA